LMRLSYAEERDRSEAHAQEDSSVAKSPFIERRPAPSQRTTLTTIQIRHVEPKSGAQQRPHATWTSSHIAGSGAVIPTR
jgi:hypothetical protein